MPETTHDTGDDGFHEIQLSGKQLVFLFIVTTSVLVAVFLCGVLVGRGARGAAGDERDLIADAAPTAQPAAESGPPGAEPPAPAADSADELSYHKRLQGASPPAETLRTPAAEPTPAAKEQPVAAPPPAAPLPPDVPVTGRPGKWVVQVNASRDRAVAGALVKQLNAKGYPAFLVSPAAGVAEQFYKVHVGRYNDRSEAEQVSLRLRKEEQFQPWVISAR